MNDLTPIKINDNIDEQLIIEILDEIEEKENNNHPIVDINSIDEKRLTEKIFIDLTQEDLSMLQKEVNNDLKEIKNLFNINENPINDNIVIDLIDDNLLGSKRHREDSSTDIIQNDYINLAKNQDINSKKISITSYNILNQKYIKKKSRNDLSLDNRMKNVIKELEYLNSDIICLQEANSEVYNKYISKILKYTSNFGVNSDSSFYNIISYNKDRFKLIKFFNYDLKDYDIDGNRGINYVILDDKLFPGNKVLIFNIHLPWKPKYEFHRCNILSIIFEDILKLKIPNVLLAGDFNSIPESLPIKLIYDRHFEINDEIKRIIDSKNLFDDLIKTQNQYTTINLNSLLNSVDMSKKSLYSNLYHSKKKIDDDFDRFTVDKYMNETELKEFLEANSKNLNNQIFKKIKNIYKFVSSYQDYKSLLTGKMTYLSNNHPDYTIYTINYRKNIDYIFYSSSSLELLKIYKLPEKKDIEKDGFLPSGKYPSDHLKIYSEFKYKI